jgi:hypothetical protein
VVTEPPESVGARAPRSESRHRGPTLHRLAPTWESVHYKLTRTTIDDATVLPHRGGAGRTEPPRVMVARTGLYSSSVPFSRSTGAEKGDPELGNRAHLDRGPTCGALCGVVAPWSEGTTYWGPAAGVKPGSTPASALAAGAVWLPGAPKGGGERYHDPAWPQPSAVRSGCDSRRIDG